MIIVRVEDVLGIFLCGQKGMKNYIYVLRIFVVFFKIFVVSEGWYDFSFCVFNFVFKIKFFIKRFGYFDVY